MTINVSTLFGGEIVEKLLTEYFAKNPWMKNELVYVHQSSANKIEIPKISLNNAAIAAYDASGSVKAGSFALDAYHIDKRDLETTIPYSPNSLRNYWKKYATDGKMVFPQLPSEIQSAMASTVLGWVSQELGKTFSTGTKVNANEFDGFVTLAKASTLVQKVTAPVALIDGDKVVSALKAVSELANTSEYGRVNYEREGFVLLMNSKHARQYRQAQKDQTNKGVDMTEKGVDKFDGKRIISLENFPENIILAGYGSTTDIESNFQALVNDSADSTFIKEAPENTVGENRVFRLAMSLGCQIIRPEGVVLYDASI